MDFIEIIADWIHSEIGTNTHEIIPLIEIPPDSNLGDFSLPCFTIAKQLKKNPSNVALDIKEKLSSSNHKYHILFERVSNAGPYLNFYVNKEKYTSEVLNKIIGQKETYGSLPDDKNIVLIESPGPNTNKPLHLGHLRNMLLGQSLANMLRFHGKNVHIVNIINDRGAHICKSMIAYQKSGSKETPESANMKPDHFVGKYYVMFQQLEKEDPNIENEVQEMLLKWENHDKDIMQLWRQMNSWALQGFDETYAKLDFRIEKNYFESQCYEQGKDIVLDGYKKGLFKKDTDNAIIVDLEDEGLGKKVLLRANGTSIYITQDIYIAKKRFDDYKFDEMYYIVGNEQDYHFKVLFQIFKKLDWKFADKCHHFSYGMVELPEGKMKSREGTVIDTDDLIDNVLSIAVDELKSRYTELDESELNRRANIIAMSAIRFFFLKFDPTKNFVFNPKESLSFDGETGPYVEYSFARINSIFRKSKEKSGRDAIDFISGADLSLLKQSNEFNIVKILASYPEILAQAINELKPSAIAHYLLKLTHSFNEFYHINPVLGPQEELTKSRLYLIYCIQIVIKSALELLNIEPIDEM